MSASKTEEQCALRERKSKFVEIFRTTPSGTVCPNFYVLAHANGCAFRPRCAYCYLKSSFWHLAKDTAFVNVDRMEREIRRWIAMDDPESSMLNMGNLSDSLAFESARPLVARLVRIFRDAAERQGRKHTLLLVTKGGVRHCRPLFDAEPCRNVIVSFSVNNPEAARRYERGAATVSDRMRAAERLKANGWRVRIRIDPMMLGFDYARTAERVRKLSPERVTLGSLRAEPNLVRRVDKGLFSDLESGGHARALARYPLKARLTLYRQALSSLRETCAIGLCEETPEVWRALGLDPELKSCNCGS